MQNTFSPIGDEGWVLLLIELGTLAVLLPIFIFFLVCLSTALSRCHPRNRTMEPGMVWLMLIPVFGLAWQFLVVNRISESLAQEYRARRLRPRGDYANEVGIAFCVFSLIFLLPSRLLELIALLAGLVCFIVYWAQIGGYSAYLAQDGRPRDPDSREDEYEDDRPRRSRRAEREDEYVDRPRRSLRDDGE